MRRSVPAFLMCVLALAATDTATSQRYEKLSPFDGLRFHGAVPEVAIGKTWYTLLAIDKIPTSRILDFCEKRYRGKAKKRFGEDLVQVLAEMGHAPRPRVDLKVADLASRRERVFKRVRMTADKRRAIWRANKQGPRRVNPGSGSISRERAGRDLDRLLGWIEDVYSYRDLRGADPRQLVARERGKLPEQIPVAQFAQVVMRILAAFGDGHTRVQGSSRYLPPGFTPFGITPLGGRMVALAAEGGRLLDRKHPFIHSIDGTPSETWLEAVATIVPRGSRQFVRSQAAWRLQSIQFARSALGRPAKSSVEVVLIDAAGKKKVTKRLDVAARPARPRRFPPRGHRVLARNIGYLRIPSMESGRGFRGWLREAMVSLKKTKGLVIDVRENGGGSREALRTLLPYFLSPEQSARVVNVAAYRLHEGDAPDKSEGYLQNRFLYPEGWSGWSVPARKAIAKVARGFRPDWKLPAADFSAWHYMVVERGDAAFRYARPVVVLVDAGCFSATDIFLGGFKGLSGVTLLGTASGGGSGRSRPYELANSGLTVRISSMASFLPGGSRYDGKGVAPDVVVEPVLTDLTGQMDSVLEAALARLR